MKVSYARDTLSWAVVQASTGNEAGSEHTLYGYVVFDQKEEQSLCQCLASSLNTSDAAFQL